jgi:Asp-tRNA(Asn)/Glu-tRNA(Gln) amidotransferase A subunit family amidase
MFSTVRRGLVALALLAGFLVAGTGTTAAAPSQSEGAGRLAGLVMERVTIPQLQAAMDSGRLSSTMLTNFYLDRIDRIDPLVNAVLAVNGNARSQAADSDRVRRSSGPRSLLEGIPVLLKDNIDTVDQGATAGSEALLLARPDDAELVQRLRDAGAVILGKANLSEWANFRDFNSTSGWSAVGGQTNNPYVLDRNPCGSSSGSGAGVAASLAVVAIGTETDGSIVCPAGQNGVVGHKPTLGLVSGDGVVPISSEQDTAGPMARNVTDAAIVLDIIDGANQDYTDALDPGALQGARIGVWTSATGGTSPEVDELFQETITRLQQLAAAQQSECERVPGTADRIRARHRRLPRSDSGAAPQHSGTADRVQPGASRDRAAVLRPGDLRTRVGHRRRSQRSGLPTRSADRHQFRAVQHQQHPGQVQPRRDRRTDEQPGLADHAGRGRRIRVRVVRPGCGGRLPERVRADGLCRSAADRYVCLRGRVGRRNGARSCLRLGASDAGTPASDLPSDDRLILPASPPQS